MYALLLDRNPQQLMVGDHVVQHKRDVVSIARKRDGAYIVEYDNGAKYDAAALDVPNVDILRPLNRFRCGD